MLEKKEKHPSYGMLQFCRVSGGTTALFGSSIQHRDTIRLYIREGEVSRELNRDWYFGNREIMSVEMSYSQFAEAITSLNHGSGVPVTIRAIQGQPIEPCPFVDKKQQFESEFAQQLDSANETMHSLVQEVSALFNEKKAISKRDREEILSKLYKVQAEVSGNAKFTYQMFNEQMEKTTQEAKGEIEAFMQNKVNSLAAMSLVENKPKIKATKYRTVATIYPYESFEVEIEVNGEIVYANIDVSGMEGVQFSEAFDMNDLQWWCYTKSLDDDTLDIGTDFASLDETTSAEVAKLVVTLWNENPHWDSSSNWHTI